MRNISRRQFCINSLVSSGALTLNPWAAIANSKIGDDDHFFIQFVVQGGWDPSYLFDGRPLQMTKDKIIQNYTGQDPKLLLGRNGTSCFVGESAKTLLDLKDYFSIINGVHMASSDGHVENMNFLFSGNPFGGSSFLPYISQNSKLEETSIVGILDGFIFARLKNHGEIIPLSASGGGLLIESLKKNNKITDQEEIFQFIRQRYLENAKGSGKFSLANKKLVSSFNNQESLYDKLSNLNIDSNLEDKEKKLVEILAKLFKEKVARLALVSIDVPFENNNFINLDTHGFEDAKKQPELYSKISKVLANYITLLRQTPYDSKRSLMDVTTFIVTSEFTRTMRQDIVGFDTTGTDHNPLNNSFLVGGKKINTGLVIGESDFRTSDEVLSKAHMNLDKAKLKVMGKPFDFNTMKPSSALPEQFNSKDYLSMHNVANTLMDVFSVEKNLFWKKSNGAPSADTLNSLIKT